MLLPLPIGVGQASTDSKMAAALGTLVWSQGKAYRVAKAGATIATAASLVLISARLSGQPTWVYGLPTAQEYQAEFYGVVPVGQVGSGTTTTSLVSGDYFLIQVAGPTVFKTSAAINAGESQVLVALSTGKVKLGTLTTIQVGSGTVGFPLHTANATAADVAIGGRIAGIF